MREIKNETMELSVEEYIATVDGIVKKYFDSDGEYQPHWGYLGTVAIFYSLYYGDSDTADGIIDSTAISEAINDSSFSSAFRKTISGENDYGVFNFYRAYQDAMRIVEQKNGFSGTVRGIMNGIIGQIGDLFKTIMNDDNISQLKEIATMVNKGELTPEAISDSYLGKIEKQINEKTANVIQLKK